MRQPGGIVTALAVALGALAVAPLAADLAGALRAIDDGRGAEARGPLSEEIARLSYYLALAETGAARQAAAERARDLAAERSWVRPASVALLAEESDQSEAAIAGYRDAVGRAPEDARLWSRLGSALLRHDERGEARAAFERAIALDPGHRPSLIAVGDLLRGDGDFGGAYNAYNHAIDETQAPFAALYGRATAKLYLGDRDGALADLDRAAAAASPGAERSRALMGSLFVRAYERRLPEGLDRAEEAVRMWGELGRPDMVAATLNAAARALLETGDAVSAEAWYERGWQAVEGASLPPEQRTLWQVRRLHGQARCAAVRRETERADALAQEARDLMAADLANREHYAWIEPYLNGYLALSQRRFDVAIAELQRSDLERAHIRMLLADAYARSRDRVNARLWYERALAAATGLDVESVVVRPTATSWLAKNR